MKGRVLFVEDDVLLGRQLVRLLHRNGYEVTHVTTCAAARALRASFDIAVLDGELPDGYGCELYGELLDAGVVPCAVFFTGARVGGLVLSAGGFTRSVEKIDGVHALLQAMQATLDERLHVAAAAGAERHRPLPAPSRDAVPPSGTRGR